MKFLVRYAKQHRLGIVVFFLFCIIFLIVFLLYRLPVGAVLYPAFLCGVVGLSLLIYDCNRAYQKHCRLQDILKLSATLIEQPLPAIDSQLDADYQQIIRQLREEQKRLENRKNLQFSDMVDYFTVWAHQIKTPIASMRLSLQNEDSELSRRLSEDLFRIEQYVEMVLCYLRLDSEYTDYVIREQDLDVIIKQAVRKFSGQFIRKKIRLKYEPVNASVVTDEKWLQFVLEQVLSNALKYTPDGGTVCIDMERPHTLCIRDTGIGIAPEDLPRIFEKGYTGYNGRNDKKATGLGLYLCRRICKNLDHGITANSSFDSGTVIRIHLEQKRLELE